MRWNSSRSASINHASLSRGRAPIRRWMFAAVFLVALGGLAVTVMEAEGPDHKANWPMFGQNLANVASGSDDTNITTKSAGRMQVKWAFTTAGDVSARAIVVNGVAYFPDWAGNIWAVNAASGAKIWSHQLSDYGLATGAKARRSPAVVNGYLYLGTQKGAYLLAINAATGDLVWQTQLESVDPFAIITASPSVSNGVVFAGVASLVEGGTFLGFDVSKPARGSVVAVNDATGAIQWKTYMVPPGYSGGGVWGSNPVVDTGRNTVFVGTGNSYRHPDDSAVSSNPLGTYGQCIAAGGKAASCNSLNYYVDAIVALDLTT